MSLLVDVVLNIFWYMETLKQCPVYEMLMEYPDVCTITWASRLPLVLANVLLCEPYTNAVQATRAYLHAESDVEKALNEAGFTVVKREMTATSFYFSRLLEAVRK